MMPPPRNSFPPSSIIARQARGDTRQQFFRTILPRARRVLRSLTLPARQATTAELTHRAEHGNLQARGGRPTNMGPNRPFQRFGDARVIDTDLQGDHVARPFRPAITQSGIIRLNPLYLDFLVSLGPQQDDARRSGLS